MLLAMFLHVLSLVESRVIFVQVVLVFLMIWFTVALAEALLQQINPVLFDHDCSLSFPSVAFSESHVPLCFLSLSGVLALSGAKFARLVQAFARMAFASQKPGNFLATHCVL